MLCAGLALRNVPYVGERIGERVDIRWSAAIRSLALTLILCRAGLAFDVDALKRLRFVVARLAALPCLTEAAVIAGLAAALLDFPLAWAALLGFIVAAISPAVVVPSLLSLQERGYGTSTGIPTLVVAAAPLDDVLAIAGFGICLSFSVGGSGGGEPPPLWLDVARAPLELVLGLAAGLLGSLLVLLLAPPGSAKAVPAQQREGALALLGRVAPAPSGGAAVLFCLCASTFLGLKRAGFSGASALSVLVAATGAARRWGAGAAKPVAGLLADAWNRLAQPLLFGLVGASVAVGSLEARVVGLGLAMLACSVTIRCTVAYLAVGGRGLTPRERAFTAIAWLPKATVQAAIGAAALDEATTEREKQMGRDIVAIAVMSILCTAPLGAVAIPALGPRLLRRDGGDAVVAAAAAAPKDEVKVEEVEVELAEEMGGVQEARTPQMAAKDAGKVSAQQHAPTGPVGDRGGRPSGCCYAWRMLW